VCPRASPSPFAMMRPSTSVGPPAANGITMVIGRVGKSSARAIPVNASVAASAAAKIDLFIEVSLDGAKSRVPRVPGQVRRASAQFNNLFGELVQPVARSVAADEIVVAEPVKIAAVDVGGVHHDVHILGDGPGLVMAHQRPFHEIVALAVAVEA